MHRHPDVGELPESVSPYASHDLGLGPQVPMRGWPLGADSSRMERTLTEVPPRLKTPMGLSASTSHLHASLHCMSTQQMFQAHAERAQKGGFARPTAAAVAPGEFQKNALSGALSVFGQVL